MNWNLRSLLLVLAFAPSASARDVLHVPTTDYPDIQSAIDAAVSGDIVLVQPGAYPPFAVDGTSTTNLTILGDPRAAGDIDVGGPGLPIRIDNIPAGSFACVRGINAVRNQPGQPAVLVDASLGSVWIEEGDFDANLQGLNCQLVGDNGRSHAVGTVFIRDSSDVHLRDCEVEGIRGWSLGSTGGTGADEPGGEPPSGSTCPGSPGIQIESSTVGVWDSTVVGGSGAPGLLDPLTPGGAGLPAILAFEVPTDPPVDLFLSGSALIGGEGADAIAGPNQALCSPAGNGGPALFLDGVDAVEIGTAFLGGDGGNLAINGDGTVCPQGLPGLAQDVQGGGSFLALLGPARSLTSPALVEVGQIATFGFQGDASGVSPDMFQLLQGPPAAFGFLAVVNAMLAISSDGVAYVQGTVGPTGMGLGNLNTAVLQGTTGVALHFQALFDSGFDPSQPGLRYHLSPPTCVVVVP